MKTWSPLPEPALNRLSSMPLEGKAESAAGKGGGGGAAVGSLAGPPQECAGCGKKITERFLLKALDMFWHEDCLKCGCCDCRLGEVGSTLYTKADLILCRRDYLRLFGNTGHCAACSKVIPAFEMVMRARSNVYHLECFACQQCNHRFCVGDRFYLCDNKILCEYDYEERLVFAHLAVSPSGLALAKRQAATPTGPVPPPGAATHNGLSAHPHSHAVAQVAAGALGGQLGGPLPSPGDLNNNSGALLKASAMAAAAAAASSQAAAAAAAAGAGAVTGAGAGAGAGTPR